jgi:hypothetical protein
MRLSHTGIACALVVVALSGSAVASANWTTNGNATGVAATGAGIGGSLMTVVTTGAATQGIRCTDRDDVYKVYGPFPPSGITVEEYQFSFFTSCTLVGQNAAIKCGTASLNAVSYSAATNLTSGNVTGISCVITKAACGNSTSVTGGITLTGSFNVTYGNTSQQLAIATAGQSLSASWSGAGCLSGTSPGSVRFTNSSGTASLASITSAFKPQITN